MSTVVRNLPKVYSEETLVPTDVLEEIEAILSSEEFRGSQRSQAFLRHIVEAFYRGDEDSLKERTLGIEIFGRTPDYDTGADAIVRVTAHETRRRLASYHLACKNRPVSITMKPGTYVPSIERQAVELDRQEIGSPSAVATLPESSPFPEPLIVRESKHRITPRLWVGAACLLLVVGLVIGWGVMHARNAIVRNFWGPLFSDKKIIICTSKPEAYAIGSLFTTSGDADLALRIRDKLVSIGHPTRMAIASDLSESDFKEAPAVLIGSSGTNSWTANAANGFRFQYDTLNGNPVIRDVQNSDRIWKVPEKPDASHATEDYAVITRLTHSPIGPGLIAIAGSSSLSTHASGVALLSPESLNNLLKEAPNDWPQKNLQLVIRFHHALSVDYAPQVVAAVYW